MTNIISPTREQVERLAYWEKIVKENPKGDEELEEETI